MAQVNTGYEPSGSNWTLVTEDVFQQGVPNTPVVAGYQDFNLFTILGKSLFGNYVTMQQLYDTLTAQGYVIYYMGGWNDPPGFIGTDHYRITWLRKA